MPPLYSSIGQLYAWHSYHGTLSIFYDMFPEMKPPPPLMTPAQIAAGQAELRRQAAAYRQEQERLHSDGAAYARTLRRER